MIGGKDTGVGFPNLLYFIGVVENNSDERLEGRVQVRAFGVHGTVTEVPTADLPWATLIIGNHDVNFTVPPINSWVFGAFLDGRDAQQPIIFGLIPTQMTEAVNPAVNGWGVAFGNEQDRLSQGSRPQDAGQPTLSRLARGEELDQTNILAQETNRKKNIEIAGGSSKTLYSTGNMGVTSQDEGGSLDIVESVDPTKDVTRIVSTAPGENTIELADGSIVRRVGARNWRNNNPGNIEYGNFSKSKGAIGSDGRFAIFPSYEAGRAAKRDLLFGTSSYAGKTVSGAINRYAPPSENNTNAYIRSVTSAVGVTPDTPMSSLTAAQQDKMLDAMERVEGFKVGKTETIQEADGTLTASAGSDSLSGGEGSDTLSEDPDSRSTAAGSVPETSAEPAVTTSWEEPAPAYHAKYPYNRVVETASGHSIEIDDTPGSERIMIWHKSGSYIQLSTSTFSTKSHGDSYAINERNHHVYVGGTNVITVEGDSHFLVKGNRIDEVMGDYKLIVHGNHEAGVGGQLSMNSSDEANIRAARVNMESNVENTNIKVGKVLRFETTETIHLKTKNMYFETAETMNITVGTDLIVKAAGKCSVAADSDIYLKATGAIHGKAEELFFGGGSKVDLNADEVNIDDIVNMANGESSAPQNSGLKPKAAESATAVQRPAPPAKGMAGTTMV